MGFDRSLAAMLSQSTANLGNDLSDAFNNARAQAAAEIAAQVKRQREDEQYRYDQQNRAQAQSAIDAGDYGRAAAYYAAAGDDKSANSLNTTTKNRSDIGAVGGSIYASTAREIYKLPYEQRRAALDSMAPVLETHGISRQQIAGFDPTDDNLRALAMSGISVKDQYSAENDITKTQIDQQKANTDQYQAETERNKPLGVSMGGALVTPDGAVLYQAPNYISAGTDENLIEIGGSQNQNQGMTGNQAAVAGVLSQHLPAHIVAGFLGNIHHESGFQHQAAVGDGGKAMGLVQWHPDRRANFERVFGKPFSQSTAEEQAKFIIWELRNTEKGAYDKIMKAKNPKEAAYLIDRYYERSAGHSRKQRMESANQYYEQISNKQQPYSRNVNVIQKGVPKSDKNGAAGSDEARKPVPVGEMNRYRSAIQDVDSLDRLMKDFNPNYAGRTITGDLGITAENLGIGGNAGADWWRRAYELFNIQRHELFGASLTEGEKKAFERTVFNPRQKPEQIIRFMTDMRNKGRRSVGMYQRGFVSGGYRNGQVFETSGGRDYRGFQ